MQNKDADDDVKSVVTRYVRKQNLPEASMKPSHPDQDEDGEGEHFRRYTVSLNQMQKVDHDDMDVKSVITRYPNERKEKKLKRRSTFVAQQLR